MKYIKTRQELIKSYLSFFNSKGHKTIPYASLIPENDPTVLFTTAGMHPLVPYLLGQKHPLGKKLCSIQKCIRTGDIDEVGDECHHTFFEMLGNWSLGDYWKKEAISYSFEFLTKILKIKKEKISVSCFKGDETAEKDTESEKIWKSLGINKIKFLGKNDNWWGPAGETGPCGPDTEIFVNEIEIWNNVFMQYNKEKSGEYKELKQKNVDTGMGVERTLALLNNTKDNYETSLFKPMISEIENISKKEYKDNKKEMRIIADHIKASVFIIGEGITPSNTGQGYVLRRLIRRAVVNIKKLEASEKNQIKRIVDKVFEIYPDYVELNQNREKIYEELEKEEVKFNQTLNSGMKKFNELAKDKIINGKDAFLLFQSYGFPIEITKELAIEKKVKVDLNGYENEAKKHQELSRINQGTFKSGLADNSETTTKLHTATHLLNRALKIVLKDKNIHQKGSNITSERLRFDFNFPRAITENEIAKIEALVNEQIKKAINVKVEQLPLKKAIEHGAQAVFSAKYPEIVTVYTIGDFSKEICTGPHVKNTREIGKFKIIKEESAAAGIRRIKAVIS
ncbi:MAG: alanine--tRNA ligase [Candidatus Pacearchaeota archaeon]